MNNKKPVTLITDLDQRKHIPHASVVHGDMSLKDLAKFHPGFKKSPSLNTLFVEGNGVRHIIICLYKDKQGVSKRRIAGMGRYEENNDFILGCVTDMAGSLGIKIDRAFFNIAMSPG